jgi:putative transposase
MTVNPHSIDLSTFVAEHLKRAEPDLLRSMLSSFIQALMSAEADAVCGAPYGARSAERTNSRNGYRSRDFDTRAGTVQLAIPKLRGGSYFPDWLLERRRRAERLWSRWWRPATCLGSRPGEWRGWLSSWASPGCPSLR